MTVFQMLRKTYSFILLRLFVVIMTIIPIIFLTTSFAEFFFRLFGIQTYGVVYTIFYLNFAIIGFMVGIVVVGFFSKTLLFYIKIAHVIAITKICTDDDTESFLFFTAIKEVIRHFLSINLFYVADKIVLKGIQDVKKFLMKKEGFSINNEDVNNSGRLKKLCLRFLGNTVSKTLSYCDELVLSYVYVQWRIFEIYHSEEDLSKKEKIQQSLKYVVDGICLYLKNCISLMKSAFYIILTAEIFSWIVTLFIVFFVWVMLSKGILTAFLFFVFSRIIYFILSYAVLEAYETVVLVTTFYNVLYDNEEEVDFISQRNKIAAISPILLDMVKQAFGEENLKANVDNVENMIDGNLFNILKTDILDILKGGTSKNEH